MASSSISKALRHKIQRVKKLAPPPPEELLYPWLKHVLMLGREIEGQGPKEAKRITQELRREYDLRVRAELFRVLVELTVGEHVEIKMRNKYASALRWSRQKGVSALGLPLFIAKNGGLNGCYEKARRKRNSRQKSALRKT